MRWIFYFFVSFPELIDQLLSDLPLVLNKVPHVLKAEGLILLRGLVLPEIHRVAHAIGLLDFAGLELPLHFRPHLPGL